MERGLDVKSETAILAGVSLFKELNTTQLDRVAQGTHEVKVTKGGLLFNKGAIPDGFYIVIDGRIKLSFISREGKEYIAEIFGPGESFGEAVMFLDRPYPVCAQALKDSTVLHVSKDVILHCVEQNPGFSLKIIAGLCDRLADRVLALEFLTVHSSVQRVVGYLLREIEYAECERDGADVLLEVSKATIAAQLNLTPETLSRVLHRLSEEGLVNVEGKVIRIRQMRKLRAFDG